MAAMLQRGRITHKIQLYIFAGIRILAIANNALELESIEESPIFLQRQYLRERRRFALPTD
jgi:hypothetical protein